MPYVKLIGSPTFQYLQSILWLAFLASDRLIIISCLV
jgi:hypothetical protein